MSAWPSVKAKKLNAALLRIGWRLKRSSGGSHRVLSRDGWPDVVFAFHDRSTVPPEVVARIARVTGLRPEDL